MQAAIEAHWPAVYTDYPPQRSYAMSRQPHTRRLVCVNCHAGRWNMCLHAHPVEPAAGTWLLRNQELKSWPQTTLLRLRFPLEPSSRCMRARGMQGPTLKTSSTWTSITSSSPTPTRCGHPAHRASLSVHSSPDPLRVHLAMSTAAQLACCLQVDHYNFHFDEEMATAVKIIPC